MFNRPRCRDWTPLATQQLRLRNLIQITGHNIKCDEKCSVYYTLHMTSMSSPFFTSEISDSPTNAIWPEINLQNLTELGTKSVCIRVWKHFNGDNKINNEKTINSLKTTVSDSENDKLLFLWGVYFSGLVQIPNKLDVSLNENSLVLHMHGGYFTSSECILDKINLFELNKETHMPESDCESLTGEKLENDNILYRFISKKFLKSEIRPSYNVKKLLQLHETQRDIKFKVESSKELMEKICMKSAFCLNLELIANKSVIYHSHYQAKNRRISGMGKTLNRLLFQENEPPKPEVVLKAQQIRRQIEVARFRCRLLIQEKDRTNILLRHSCSKLTKLTDSNNETELWLLSHYRNLNKEKESSLQDRVLLASQRELHANAKIILQYRKIQLLKELNDIYCVSYVNQTYMINGIILPDAESYTERNSPSDISVALGYVAHVTILCSIILNVPLRNNIIYKGSCSRILDNIKILPHSNREFPLYSKDYPPQDDLKYAVFLLNQNIAQLKFLLGLSRTDLRQTLFNLYQLLHGPPKELPMRFLTLENSSVNQVSISNSSIDLDCIVIPLHNNTTSALKKHNIENRISRSFDNSPENSGTPERSFGSEPLLANNNNYDDKLLKNLL